MSVIIEKKQLLRMAIIKQLFYRNILSVADIARLTKKSVPLVTNVIDELVQDGHVIEQGLAPSTGGRRAVVFHLNPDIENYIVAVSMDQLKTQLIIYNMSSQIVLPVQSLNFDIKNEKHGIQKLVNLINISLDKAGILKTNVLGVGIGMPGFVNVEKGINYSQLIPEGDIGLRDYLTKELGLPVYIDNDSSLIALAELRFGGAMMRKDTLVVNIGWGTGLGMVINGELYRGSSGYAGEFSHIPLSENNALCSCGKRGCLEVETSLLVMVENSQQAIKKGAKSILQKLYNDKSIHPGEHFLSAVMQHDPLAISVLFTAAFHLGKGLATLIHIMNPEAIILSGRVSEVGKLLLPPIQQAINEFCIPRIAEQTTILMTDLGKDAALRAAASLVIENNRQLIHQKNKPMPKQKTKKI